MNKINHTCDQLHQQAMHLANLAVAEGKKGNAADAQQYFKDAFQFEQQAAMKLANEFNLEPSRSVLFRSAAFLALKAKRYREAERMAAFGLSGNPPAEIADELRDAFHQSMAHIKMVA